MTDSTHITLTAPPSVNMALVVGAGDCLLHIIEEAFDARITVRGDSVVLEGDSVEVQSLMALFSELFKFVEGGGTPDQGFIQRSLDLLRTAEFTPSMLREDILLTYRGRAIRPKTAGQKHYVDAIRKNTITFGIGPAGTGKTYLAVALAAFALRNHDVQRIILVRPAVEAGEKLGFLPGDMQEKVNPYLRPLFDGLMDMFGPEEFTRLQQKGQIEVAPLAYMRGRTLEKSFVILDEAQNTTVEQIKMFLTRLGFRSKMIVNGDVTQIDLPPNVRSGLIDAERVLKDVKDIGHVHFSEDDVVRHDLVAAIIHAYEEDARHRNKNGSRKGERKENKEG